MQQHAQPVKEMTTFAVSLSEFHEDLPNLAQESTQNHITNAFGTVSGKGQKLSLSLETMKLPRHRPIDVQSSDAGPGVGKDEKIVIFRNAECFLINDLYLQSRLHYATRDSKIYSDEKITSTLNEAAGDGTSIKIDKPSLSEEENTQLDLFWFKKKTYLF